MIMITLNYVAVTVMAYCLLDSIKKVEHFFRKEKTTTESICPTRGGISGPARMPKLVNL